eukprot:gene11855-24847_t
MAYSKYRDGDCSLRTCCSNMVFENNKLRSISKLGTIAATQYSHFLTTNPLVTNIVTASALCVFADSVAQKIERASIKKKDPIFKISHSYYRSLCMAAYGAAVFGYFIHHWYRLLDFLVPRQGITIPLIILKVSINQVCMSPSLNAFFFGYVILTRDMTSTIAQKISTFKSKIANDLLPTIYRSCLYWGIVQ